MSDNANTVVSGFHVNDEYLSAFKPGTTSVSETINLNTVTPGSNYAWFTNLWVTNKDGSGEWVYMQLQPTGNLANNTVAKNGLVNFSLWNATSATPATGSQSESFGNEGAGYRITQATTIASGGSFTESFSMANGVISGYLTNNATGTKTLIGSFKDANAVSFSSACLTTEYYGTTALGKTPAGDVSFSGLTTNTNSPVTVVQVSQNNGGVALTGLNYLQEMGASYSETSSGGAINTVTLGGTSETITGSGGGQLNLKTGFTNLTSDTISGVTTLNENKMGTTMTASQFKGFSAILNHVAADTIVFSGASSNYKIAAVTGGETITDTRAGTTDSLTLPTGDIAQFSNTTVKMVGKAQLHEQVSSLTSAMSSFYNDAASSDHSASSLSDLLSQNVSKMAGAISQYSAPTNSEHSLNYTSATDSLVTLVGVQPQVHNMLAMHG